MTFMTMMFFLFFDDFKCVIIIIIILFVIVPIKGPRRDRVTYKTNIDSMYIYNNTTFNVRI
jgi:hypothetical protein